MVPRRFLLAAVLLLPTATVLPAQDASSRQTWDSAELGLRMTAPNQWLMLTTGPLEAILSPPFGKAKIAIFSLPLDDMTDPDLDRITEEAVESQRAKFAKFKLLGNREVTVAGLPGREIYFRGRLDGEKFRFVQTIFVNREHRIIVMYMSPEDGYSVHLGDYDGVLRSVSVLPQDGG